MKRSYAIIMVFFLALAWAVPALAAGQSLFGPVRYDVKERYGKANKYTGTFAAAEGTYLIELKNGNELPERSDWIEFTLNGERILSDGKYGYLFLAGFLPLKKENSFEIVLKDDKPSGFLRPALPPRFVTITVTSVPQGLAKMRGVFGINNWSDLKKYGELFNNIGDAESLALGLSAADLHLGAEQRADAMRKLADRKDRSAADLIFNLFADVYCLADVRGEAAFGLAELGDDKYISILLMGVMDPEEKVSVPSARALSFYPEKSTEPYLVKELEQLDFMRKDSVVRSIVEAGWKPVSTIMKLAASDDRQTSGMAIQLLGRMNDPRATELLLKLIENPGSHDLAVIIRALGHTKDPRALEPLLKIAQDPAKRRGREADLGDALVGYGDQRAVKPLVDMIETVETRQGWDRLREAYKKLTGKEYKE